MLNFEIKVLGLSLHSVYKYFTYFLILFLVVLPFHAVSEMHSPWKLAGANERIKKIRMGTAKLKFVNPDGTPINQKLFVKINLIKHSFQFGISLGQSWALYNQKHFEQYRNYMSDVFNLVALGFQWSWIERKKGRIRKVGHIDSNLNWAKSKGVSIKGMPLIWHNAIPKWLNEMTDLKEIEILIDKRIRYLITKYPEVKTWNLYNEAVDAEKNYMKNNAVAKWVKSKGGPAKTQAWVIKVVREIAPNKIYVNNHYSYKDPAFKRMNQELLNMGANFDAIGVQTHMHTKQNRLSEQDLWKLLEDYKVFGKPLHLTEISVPSSTPFNNWRDFRPHVQALKRAKPRKKRLEIARNSLKDFEKYQADYLKDFYTLAFSHANVGSIIYWSGSDLYEWRGTAAGLLDTKHNPKPAYYVLKNLIKKHWHTSVAKSTEMFGKYSFSGFYGEYIGKILLNGREQVFKFYHIPGQTDEQNIVVR